MRIPDKVHRAAYKHYMAVFLENNPVRSRNPADDSGFLEKLRDHADKFNALEYLYDTYDSLKEKYGQAGQKESKAEVGVERPESPAEKSVGRSVHGVV
jgi:hypothetical protein